MSSTPEESLAALVRARDRLGVLSVYVDHDPQQRARTPSWKIEIENALRDIRAAVENEPRGRRRKLTRRLESLEPHIQVLLAPSMSGRGCAFFAELATDRTHTVTVQLPVLTLAVLNRAAVVTPLVDVVERGRPAGVVGVSRSQVELYDWRYGTCEAFGAWNVDADTGEWRELKGPASANPARAQQTAPQRDRFDRRLEEHQVRFVVSLAEEIEGISESRGWNDILLGGDPRLVGPLETALPPRARRCVHRTEAVRVDLQPDERNKVVHSTLAEIRERQNVELVEQVDATAAAGDPACLGVEDTSEALSEARVSHLLLDAAAASSGLDRRYGCSGIGSGSSVPRSENLVRTALEQGADVTLVAGEAAERLREHDGVGALLRW